MMRDQGLAFGSRTPQSSEYIPAGCSVGVEPGTYASTLSLLAPESNLGLETKKKALL